MAVLVEGACSVATRGRPRKPVAEHVENGTYRPNKHGPLPLVPDPVEGAPEKPADLPPEVAAKWDEIVPHLCHLLRPRDLPLVVNLSWWMAEQDRLRETLKARKPGQKGYCALLNALATATGVLLTLSQRFGLSPGDRSKMKVISAAASTPTKPKVATRPRTSLDAAPPTEAAG
jgi:phage terminase small subunit